MNLFENLQLMKENKALKERSDLSPSEYNKLKIALNKNNPMRGNFIIHPGKTRQTDYKLIITIYGAFKSFEKKNISTWDKDKIPASDKSKEGLGIELYTLYLNLIDNDIKFVDKYYIDEYYIDRYVNSLIQSGALDNKNEIDKKSLLNTIKQAAENSKESVTQFLLSSKNFIYNLSGSAKSGKQTDYTLDLNENKVLNEDFDPSMPNWLKIAIKNLNGNDKYGHKDYSQNYSLDTLKWTVEPFPKEKGKVLDIENNEKGEIIALLIDESGDKHLGDYIVYCPKLNIGYTETIDINGRTRQIAKISLRSLAPYVKEYAHAIDSQQNRDDVRDKKINRANNQEGSINRTDVGDYWKNTYSTYDKSGYMIDPKKYKRLLAQKNASKYSQQLEDLYVVLNDVKEKLNNYIVVKMPDAKMDKYISTVNIKKCIDIYATACDRYRWATDSLKEIESGNKSYYREGFEKFKQYITECNLKVVELLNIIEKIETSETK